MDDAAMTLSRAIEAKLAELDYRIAAYRADMAAEFHAFSRGLLQAVPDEVSARVEVAIAESLTRYPNLGREFASPPSSSPSARSADSHSSSVSPRQMRPTRGSPPPTRGSPPPTPGVAAAGADDSAAGTPELTHDREVDLAGLFTPGYLPLLDSPHQPRSASPATMPSPKMRTLDELSADETEGEDDGAPPPSALSPLLSAHIQVPVRPSQVRRATDETTSSVLSDRSDSSKVRRSALRRSSSASKPQSPRRVRFDFEGGEVLPTASPQTPVDIVHNMLTGPRPGSAVPVVADSPVTTTTTSTTATATPPSPTATAISAAAAHSLLGDGPGGDVLPPRKVSSSQALRALSRAPVEDGTVWTVVNPLLDEEGPDFLQAAPLGSGLLPTAVSAESVRSVDTVRMASANSSSDTLRRAGSASTVRPLPEPGNSVLADYDSGEDNGGADGADYDDNHDSSDEEFLSMAKPKSKESRGVPAKPRATENQPAAAASPSSAPQATHSPRQAVRSTEPVPSPPPPPPPEPAGAKASPGAAKKKPNGFFIGSDDDDDDNAAEEGMFTFDADLEDQPQGKPTQTPVPADEEEDEDEGAGLERDANEPETENEAAISSTPVPMPVMVPTPASRPSSREEGSRFTVGSMGSYMGRSIAMPIVIDSELYDRVMKLENIKSFIGSVDGRTGADSVDMNSCRGQLDLSATPRSLMERVMMDDLMERRRAAMKKAARPSEESGSGK